MSTCQKIADIIVGEVVQSNPCVVLSFEKNGLNLGESVLLEREVNPMLDALRKRGLKVTAIHNHWLFEEPRLMYMHWENVGMDPFEFAKRSFEAAREAGLKFI
ncbi:DUF1259 domain-containing protein [Rummeliibacillus sp. TYF-LIM-RU47]|uniref:DUF1259 domain-containing protein n=1 Tax=Rummeliibacillus sp. TYF-LIM-RU47 TaxID=2608406 RepID=UPI0012398C8D|nr:DUF1259 domain-containing protein [Rummeliibacillus sp. TYF-LIM-RU47]